MARLNPSPIRMYRGTTAQHSQYAGPVGELTVDTDKNTVVVQNGTQGGVPLAQEKRQVIAGAGIKVNGGASGTLASDLTVAVDAEWLKDTVPAGEQGPQGDPGPAGADGAAATISVGSVTTGEAGTQASVTNAGTSSAAVLNFTIPRGAKGDKGDKGEQGERGPEGPAGADGADGARGPQGPVGPAGEYTAGDGITISGDTLSVNNTVVRTSGNQTISGEKTFTGYTIFYQDIRLVGSLEEGLDNSPQIEMPISITRGTSPSKTVYAGLRVTDNADANLAMIQSTIATNGDISTSITSYRNDASANSAAYISIVYPKTGDPYATAPSTRATPLDNEIVTVDYLKGANSGVVHTTGNEAIQGTKDFQRISCGGDLKIRGGCPDVSPQVDIYFNEERGTHPEADRFGGVVAYDNDTDQKQIGGMFIYYTSSGSTSVDFRAYKADSTNSYSTLGLTNPIDGPAYATAPNTRSTPSANEIITYDFLKTYVANNAPKTSYLPLYFTADSLELHSFVPAGVTKVRYAAIEADGSGTSGLTIKMTRDIGSTSSMNVTGSNANCSGYANHSVMFSVSGISNQTEIAVMVEFN